MAYKNKKKNKTHQAEIRKSNSSGKHERKRRRYERKHPPEKLTMERCEMLLRERGLI